MTAAEVCLKAKKKGYHARFDGVIVNKEKVILTCSVNRYGYPEFRVFLGDDKYASIRCHKFVAYLKYGAKSFKKGVHIRHKDGDKMNFSWKNILLGDAFKNSKDKKERALNAGRKKGGTDIDYQSVIHLRRKGWSYFRLAEWFEISVEMVRYIVNSSAAARSWK